MKAFIFTFIFVFSQLALGKASVVATTEYSEIFQAIDQSYAEFGEDLLVVFDIDDTLIVTEHCLKENGERTKGIGKFFHCPSEHTEDIVAIGITQRQNLGMHTLALTARGKNLIRVTEREFLRQHPGLGTFNFRGKPYSTYIASLPVEKTRRCRSKELPPCLRGEKSLHPRFKNGVLYAQGAHKGLALSELLSTLNVQYSKIIFIDDRSKNTEDVEEVYEPLNTVDAEIFLYLRHRD